MRGPENNSKDWVGLLILLGIILALVAANNTCMQEKDEPPTVQEEVMVVRNFS